MSRLELNLQKGLVGHWTMDDADTSGGTLYDRSASDAHATLNGNPTTAQTGKVNETYDFDGVDDYLSTSDRSLFEQNEFTWTGWFYKKPNPQSYGTSFRTICAVHPFDNGLHYTSNGMTFAVDTSSNQNYIGTSSISEQEWHFVAATWDSSGGSVYVDPDGSGPDNSGGDGENPVYGSSNVQIGYGNSDRWFPGFIDDIRYYNRALSESEISALYNMREQRAANL